MIIIDENSNQSLDNISLLFTRSEALQMLGYLEELLQRTEQNEHYHLNSDDYSKEITVLLYDRNVSKDCLADKYKKLIELECH